MESFDMVKVEIGENLSYRYIFGFQILLYICFGLLAIYLIYQFQLIWRFEVDVTCSIYKSLAQQNNGKSTTN